RRPCAGRRSSSAPTSSTHRCAGPTTTRRPARSPTTPAAPCCARAERPSRTPELSASRPAPARCVSVEIRSPGPPVAKQRREPRILLRRGEIVVGLHLLGVLVLVLDRARPLIERPVDLADRGVGARRRMEDVGVLHAVGLATVGELDREPVFAERVGV